MTTQPIDNPGAGAAEQSSGNSGKMKKAAVKAAQFAAAAGVGVAGTMAAQAVNPSDEDIIGEEVTEIETNASIAEEPEAIAEPVTDFNPNDIMIEPEEVEVEAATTDEEPSMEERVNPEEIAQEIIPHPISDEDDFNWDDATEQPVMTDEPLMADADTYDPDKQAMGSSENDTTGTDDSSQTEDTLDQDPYEQNLYEGIADDILA